MISYKKRLDNGDLMVAHCLDPICPSVTEASRIGIRAGDPLDLDSPQINLEKAQGHHNGNIANLYHKDLRESIRAM